MDVVCMGSATIDLFITIDHPFKQCSAGEKLLMHDLDYLTGGGGSNAAVSLTKLGCESAYLGKVGSGVHSKRILEMLREEKVKVIPVKRSKNHTAFSIVLESSKEPDRVIYIHKGATNELLVNDFKLKELDANWLYLASVMDKTFATAKKVVDAVKKKGTKVLFNPSSYMIRNLNLSELLKKTDVLVLNKEEAELLVKKKFAVKTLGKKILEKGPSVVVITDGARGVYYFDALHSFHVESRKVKAISTAGAGDAFTSGFLAATIKGKDAPTSLRIGVANALSVIQKRGATHGLLSWNLALKQMKKLKCRVI